MRMMIGRRYIFVAMAGIGILYNMQTFCAPIDYKKLFMNSIQKKDCEVAKIFGRLLSLTNSSINFCDKHDRTPLILAIVAGDERMVRLLLRLGAEPNYPGWDDMFFFDGRINKCRNYGAPLVHAVKKQDKKIIKLLLNAGAALNSCEGLKALYLTFDFEDQGITDMLLDAGADLNQLEFHSSGQTLLMKACVTWSDRYKVMRLLDSGAELGIKDTDGETALSLSRLDSAQIFLIDRGAEYTELPEKYAFQKKFKAEMAKRYRQRGQVIKEVLEKERGLPRDCSYLVCEFAGVPEGQMPGRPEYEAYKVDRTCWGMLKQIYNYFVPSTKQKRQ